MSQPNPYNAIVAAIPLAEEFLSSKGDEGEDVWDVVLNIGEEHGISLKNTFLIFSLGPEVLDPATGQSLGHFEVVRGRGRVTHLQQSMCTVRSARTVTRRVPIGGILSAASMRGDATELREEAMPFKTVYVGDFARLIS